MGNLIDLKRKDEIYRCNYVKLSIIWINLIGPPLSLLFLLIGVVRMLLIKKRKAFLTYLIILIFVSEMIQCLSKLIQLLKYDYPDTRDDKTKYDPDNPRGIICQLQIVMAIFSDFCSLLSTLLLSLRCFDVIHNKKRFFDQGKNGILSIILFIALSIIFSIIFLLFDRRAADGNIAYRYDLRDRCSYWCWLGHIPSLFCLGLYSIILFLNIYFACKTNCYLTQGYKRLIEECQLIPEKETESNSSFNERISENSKGKEKKENENKKFIYFTPEEKKRIQQLQLMRTKCLIYPSVTIAYWIFAATYRIVDDTIMIQFDEPDKDPFDMETDEKTYFKNHNIFQFIVQISFFIYTLLSSIRGILYGFSFIVFEEKIFFNFFKKFWIKYLRDNDLEYNDEEKAMIRNTYNSSSISDYSDRMTKEGQKDEGNYSNV